MENETLHKSSIFEEKLHIAEMERQYGKEKVIEMVGESRLTEIERELRKEIAERLVPYWKDIQAYENGGFWKRFFINIKYALRDKRAECGVPKSVLQAIVDDMMPDIRAFFESEEGKREFEEWKKQRAIKKAEKGKKHKKK